MSTAWKARGAPSGPDTTGNQGGQAGRALLQPVRPYESHRLTLHFTNHPFLQPTISPTKIYSYSIVFPRRYCCPRATPGPLPASVPRFMTVSPEQVAEMENLFHSYNLLHGSFRSELQDTQRELNELVAVQDTISRKTCTENALTFVLQQVSGVGWGKIIYRGGPGRARVGPCGPEGMEA